MNNNNLLKTLKPHLFLLNQIFEVEQKLSKIDKQNSISRNLDRLKQHFETDAFEENIEFQAFKITGLFYRNPIGESYNETRLDCEATIAGVGHENLKIVDVIRPIIYAKAGNTQLVVQKAIVIVESEK